MAGPNPADFSSDDAFLSNANIAPKEISLSNVLSYGYTQELQAEELPFVGTKSIFNEYAVFRLQSAAGDHNLLYDIEGKPSITPSYAKNPSASNIISWSQEQTGGFSAFGACPYSAADFVYCTYNTLIPNNYLITLRRYPFPMVDNLKTVDGKSIPPIAQAVTWSGEETGNSLKDVLKFSFGLNWKEIEASVQEVTGNEKGFDDGPLGGLAGSDILKGALGFLNPKEYSGLSQAGSDYSQQLYGADGPYANKVYGPVNVVSKTMARDRGLHFEGDISLNFHYSLNSYGNINPKAAMLDLISNILTLTYNNAKFWGGALRYFPQYPNVKFFGDQKKFYNGDVGGYLDSMIKEFSDMGNTFMKTFEKLLSDPISALKELASGGIKLLMGEKAAESRPQMLAMRSLLTGEPVGEWHLVVGNPMNPICMIGNLICTDVEFELSDELGPDDFPEMLKVNIKLKHAKPRDKGDIESMFNLGNGRTYFGIKDSAFSSAQNSKVDASGVKGNVSTGSKDKSQVPTQTQEESAKLAQHSNNNSGNRSMWGNKFSKTEHDIAKVWAGSAKTKSK